LALEQDELAGVGEWSLQEMTLLTKGIIKFPGGTRNRWQLIAEFIGGNKTTKQVIKQAQFLKEQGLFSLLHKQTVIKQEK